MTSKLKKRLLALDGGGLMGLISLGILQRMEDELRTAYGGNPGFRLRDFFHYIGGTSTGAIIAAGLMTGRSVAEIRNIYLNDGPAMFAKVRISRRVSSFGSHKFARHPIAEMLKREFSDLSIVELQEERALPVDRHLLMVMHNVSTDSCWPVTTNPDAKYNDLSHPNCNRKLKLWQLVRASTAAPSFFPLEEATIGNQKHTFQDGGLTAHNNPALKLFQMATDPRYRNRRQSGVNEFGWETGEDRLLLVSVGTGTTVDPRANVNRRGMGLLSLAKYASPLVMRSIAIENDSICRTIGRCVHGNLIDRELGDMIETKPAARAFTYARYDADLTPSGLASLGVASPKVKLVMDNPHAIATFDEVGRMAIADGRQFSRNFSGFLD